MTSRKFRFSRSFWTITGGMVFLLVAGYFWGFQTVMCMEIRHQGRKLPILNLTPQDPPSMAASAAVGTTLSHAGFAFEVPWTDLDHEKSKFIGDIAVFVFRSGRAVSFFGPSALTRTCSRRWRNSLGTNGEY